MQSITKRQLEDRLKSKLPTRIFTKNESDDPLVRKIFNQYMTNVNNTGKDHYQYYANAYLGNQLGECLKIGQSSKEHLYEFKTSCICKKED